LSILGKPTLAQFGCKTPKERAEDAMDYWKRFNRPSILNTGQLLVVTRNVLASAVCIASIRIHVV